MHTRPLLFLVSCCFSAMVHAFTIAPAQPTSQDMVYLEKPFNNEYITSITMRGNRIVVTMVNSGDPWPVPPPQTLRVALGKLPPGGYLVEATMQVLPFGDVQSLGDASFTVARRTATTPLGDYSDLWWNSAESGWGLNFIQHPSGQAFATWFVYGPDNKPLWYVMPGGQWLDGATFRGKLYTTKGPQFGDGFDPAAVKVNDVGEAILAFGEGGRMTAVFTVNGKTVTRTLIRQSF